MAFVGRKKAIFVHGCFWHDHDCAEGARSPRSNVDYWLPKVQRNRERDEENVFALEARGWAVLIVWECELGMTLRSGDASASSSGDSRRG